ncbi:putative peptidoglycan glycosyltransferase FtsW [subsurface metagenome]
MNTTNEQQSIDFWLLTVVLILAGIGLVMVYSSSMYMALEKVGNPSFYFKKQAVRLFLGLLIMIFMTKLNYRGLINIAHFLLLVGLGLLVVILINKYITGKSVGRWLRIAGYAFQPSEFMKVALIVYMSAAISGLGEKVRDFKKGFLPLFGITVLAFLLVVLEPDLGISGLIFVIGMYLLFIGHAKLLHLIIVSVPIAGLIVLIVNTVSYMQQRWHIYLNPEEGYQISQSIISIGSGGLFGVGLGNSTQKFLFLPEQHTDFVFSILAEEIGFIGTSVVLALMFLYVVRGLRIARQTPDMFGFLLASGLTVMLGFQVFINIGVATGLLPTTGMTLPFISYGGSSLIISFLATGILLNISKHGNHERKMSREFGTRLHKRGPVF